MKITSLTLEHSNASLGPHETITTITLIAEEQHKARIHQFLDEAILNGTVSLNTYIEAVHTQQTSIVEEVQQKAPKGDLAVGGTVSELRINFEDQPAVVFSDVYRRHHLSNFYPDFTQYMVEHGSKMSYSPWNGGLEEIGPSVVELPEPYSVDRDDPLSAKEESAVPKPPKP